MLRGTKEAQWSDRLYTSSSILDVSVLLAPPTIPDSSGDYIRISIEVTFPALSIEK
jgi:hypothetical protein